MLDLSSLRKAVASLERALNFAQVRLANNNISLDEKEVIQAGVIQNFEFTYELCWKFMKRWLELNLMPGLLDGATRKELFRHAVEQKLISDFSIWVKYHELRNTTSHTYNREVADEIYGMSKVFLEDALYLLKSLEVRND
ncbi:nucleotidyltransferase substrate binding protein [Heliorestis convoluta]|uniref:nucleotidyltransferase substrate binding protein n=1 Tax=Heliorestis convoluta TaxID=356322 RepID=UPI00129AB1AC|nr:nucleotidyltransferase substrate binding protein [Heliorestis convoluta]